MGNKLSILHEALVNFKGAIWEYRDERNIPRRATLVSPSIHDPFTIQTEEESHAYNEEMYTWDAYRQLENACVHLNIILGSNRWWPEKE